MNETLCLVDSNILIRWVQPSDPDYPVVEAALDTLAKQDVTLCYTSQNLAEFWNACTRPTIRNGYRLSTEETDRRAQLFEARLRLLPDSLLVHEEWRRMLVAYRVSGVQVHDTRLAAAMYVHGVKQILTFNTRDFTRFMGIEALLPKVGTDDSLAAVSLPHFMLNLLCPNCAKHPELPLTEPHGTASTSPLSSYKRSVFKYLRTGRLGTQNPQTFGSWGFAPSFSSDVLNGLARWKYCRERMIFILCGAASLRIGEALGIDIAKHIFSDFRTILINQNARNYKIENRVKTQASYRKVDLHSSVAAPLKEIVGDRKTGLLFASRNGKPLSQSNIVKRQIHPALLKLGFVNATTGTHKAGNHAFRRYRNTYFYKYWMAHADESMSDLYDKIKEDDAFRLERAEKCGLGFELPPIIPKVSKPDENDTLLVAA
jgi:predicted nucleic acid-binding protein